MKVIRWEFGQEVLLRNLILGRIKSQNQWHDDRGEIEVTDGRAGIYKMRLNLRSTPDLRSLGMKMKCNSETTISQPSRRKMKIG